jgi:hypothetical protein
MIGHLRKTDVVGDTIAVVFNYKLGHLGESSAMKEPLFELMLTAAGLLTCGILMTVTISLSIAKTNLGSSPNGNMTNLSWKLLLPYQKQPRKD